MDALAAQYGGGRRQTRCTLRSEPEELVLPAPLAARCAIERSGLNVTIRYDKELDAFDILSALTKICPVSNVEIQGAQIEDIVMEVYRS